MQETQKLTDPTDPDLEFCFVVSAAQLVAMLAGSAGYLCWEKNVSVCWLSVRLFWAWQPCWMVLKVDVVWLRMLIFLAVSWFCRLGCTGLLVGMTCRLAP